MYMSTLFQSMCKSASCKQVWALNLQIALGVSALEDLTEVATLEEALASCEGSIGFTRRAGSVRQVHSSLRQFHAAHPAYLLPFEHAQPEQFQAMTAGSDGQATAAANSHGLANLVADSVGAAAWCSERATAAANYAAGEDRHGLPESVANSAGATTLSLEQTGTPGASVADSISATSARPHSSAPAAWPASAEQGRAAAPGAESPPAAHLALVFGREESGLQVRTCFAPVPLISLTSFLDCMQSSFKPEDAAAQLSARLSRRHWPHVARAWP